MSIVRWIEFTHPHRRVPSEATAFGAVVYTLSGFFNVILYTITHWRFLTSFNEGQITAAVEVTMKSESHEAGPPIFGPGNLDDTVSGITDDQMKTRGSESIVERSSQV
ncbi:hypothetical protein FRB95_008718 [Tulasnella sp. JGI-2019a]|nr:hypothetical protein FRB95_008718 [Tulasnella sp. JGI-2019a]